MDEGEDKRRRDTTSDWDGAVSQFTPTGEASMAGGEETGVMRSSRGVSG